MTATLAPPLSAPVLPTDPRNPGSHTCAEVRACTRQAATSVTLDHRVVVWSCGRHGASS